jgi:hypothetical protein
LRAFENRVLRRLFGFWREIVTRGWRNLHYEELHNFHSSTKIIRMTKLWRMRWARQVACMGEMRNTVVNSGGKRQLRSYRGGCEDITKIYLKEIGF